MNSRIVSFNLNNASTSITSQFKALQCNFFRRKIKRITKRERQSTMPNIYITIELLNHSLSNCNIYFVYIHKFDPQTIKIKKIHFMVFQSNFISIILRKLNRTFYLLCKFLFSSPKKKRESSHPVHKLTIQPYYSNHHEGQKFVILEMKNDGTIETLNFYLSLSF
jgi:hypothetical protein